MRAEEGLSVELTWHRLSYRYIIVKGFSSSASISLAVPSAVEGKCRGWCRARFGKRALRGAASFRE